MFDYKTTLHLHITLTYLKDTPTYLIVLFIACNIGGVNSPIISP